MTRIKKNQILVIDDSEETIKHLSKILYSAGFEVSIARNGAEGLDIFNKIRPDLTLLNLLMPVMDGFETLRKILQLDPDAKVVVNSAIDSHEMINRCLNNGALAYVTKPMRCTQLVIMLQYFLKHRVDKKINQMFLMLADKLQYAGQKLYDPSLEVLYYGSETSRAEKEVLQSSVNQQSQIIYPKNTKSSQEFTIPDKYSAFVSIISGQASGAIFCMFKDEDNYWFEKRYGIVTDGIDMIMGKMFSILSDNTGLRLDYQLPKKFKKNENIVMPEEVAKAKFEFKFPERTIVSEIQLWFNLSSI